MKSSKPKILITGGCGYLGSMLLTQQLAATNSKTKLRILDNMSSGRYQALCNLPRNVEVEFVEADILDPVSVAMALRDIDTVIHLAAIVTTPVSFEHSRAMEQINHWGTVNLINACVESNVKNFVFASTTAVYGPGGPFREDAICRPVGSFANSLLNAEVAVRASSERGLTVTILRLGMIYGQAPVMRFDNVFNRQALLASTGRTLSIFGDGAQKRPILHVRDACTAIIHCIRSSKMQPSTTFNVHSQNLSIIELTELLKSLKPQLNIRFTEQDVLTHLSFENDSSYLTSTGWSPKVSLQEGMAEILSSFRNVSSPPITTLDNEID